MGKVSELSQLIEELNRCGNTFIGISEDLKNLFSGSEEAEETEPKTKVAKETPAKAPKKEKTLSLEDVRAVMADKSRKGYTQKSKHFLPSVVLTNCQMWMRRIMQHSLLKWR